MILSVSMKTYKIFTTTKYLQHLQNLSNTLSTICKEIYFLGIHILRLF